MPYFSRIAFACAYLLFAFADRTLIAVDPPRPASAAKGAKTAEEALRRFMLGVMTSNADELKQVTLETKPDEFRWLLGSQVPPEVLPMLRKDIEGFPIERLKPGDEFQTPDGKQIVVAEDWIGEDRAVLRMKGDPLAQRIYLVKGAWRVDPAPIIAARKAIDAEGRQDK
ncbi:MAG: hypothetical protein KF708_18175 [Pirellulales bacterium]|nr:hypothetical protein [Pirellulales bacterium]